MPARHGDRAALPLSRARNVIQPSAVASDYAAITAAYRRLYTHVGPTDLHQPVIEHTRMGTRLLTETAGVSRTLLATALAEKLLLAGRIEFFDLRQPDDADTTFVRALQAAGKPMMPCSARRSSRTPRSSPAGSAAAMRPPTGCAPPAPTLAGDRPQPSSWPGWMP